VVWAFSAKNVGIPGQVIEEQIEMQRHEHPAFVF
jgi:hypothetical protein